MNLDLNPLKRPRDCSRVVVAGIIDDDHKVYDPLRHYFIVGALQSARRVISGHHHHNFLAV